jgi:hypothetical protein
MQNWIALYLYFKMIYSLLSFFFLLQILLTPNLIVRDFITLGQPLLCEEYVARKKERMKNNHKNSGYFGTLQRLRARATQSIFLLATEYI